MKRGKILISIGVLCTLCICISSQSQANPGDQKWFYSFSGGNSRTEVLINSQGYRILGTTHVTGTPSTSYWVLGCVDKYGNYQWQKSYSGPENYAVLTGIALDNSDNLIAVGWVKQSGKGFWHVASYRSTDGATNWEKDFDVGGDLSVLGFSVFFLTTDVAVDSHNNIVVIGFCLDSTSKKKGYVMFLDSNGNKNWDLKLGTEGSYAYRVVVDSHDNIIVGVNSKDTSTGQYDWLVVSLSPSGGTRWEKEFSFPGNDLIYHMAVTPSDGVVVVGTKSNSWRAVKLDSGGTLIWEDTRSGPVENRAVGVAVDSQGNSIVVGGKGADLYVVSYSPSGGENWQNTYNGPANKTDLAQSVVVDGNDNVFVAGYQYTDNTTNLYDWVVRCYSSTGTLEWTATYNSGTKESDMADTVVVDPDTGEVIVAGNVRNNEYASIADYEGYPQPSPPPTGHVLAPQEVRTIQPAASTPDSDNGKYLGFGDVVSGGKHFKIEAQFPQYLKQSDNSTMSVKIFIAAQMPDDYSRLAYFDSSNNLKFQPPEKLSSWKASVSGEMAKTTVMPEVDVTSAFSSIPAGTHYWYTLVVPDTVPDDFAGVDWATTPWEITVNIFEVTK